jgi:hypothetical protein
MTDFERNEHLEAELQALADHFRARRLSPAEASALLITALAEFAHIAGPTTKGGYRTWVRDFRQMITDTAERLAVGRTQHPIPGRRSRH